VWVITLHLVLTQTGEEMTSRDFGRRVPTGVDFQSKADYLELRTEPETDRHPTKADDEIQKEPRDVSHLTRNEDLT
jgi:hypothetical protein